MVSKSKHRTSSAFSSEFVKVVADHVGSITVSENVAQWLANDATSKARFIIQECVRFMRNSKRQSVHQEDLTFAIKSAGCERLIGPEHQDCNIRKRSVTVDGRDWFYTDDREVDLKDLMQDTMSSIPWDVSIYAHWLCIEGEQPDVPENPIRRESQDATALKTEVATVSGPVSEEGADTTLHSSALNLGSVLIDVCADGDYVNVHGLQQHVLSAEQQVYFVKVTEASVSSVQRVREEAHQSLRTDQNLAALLPWLSQFIAEGVRVNLACQMLPVLVYLSQMMSALLQNETLYILPYLHKLLPALASCTLCRKVNMKHADKQLVLRDFTAKILVSSCLRFSTKYNGIERRLINVFSSTLCGQHSLSTCYGALCFLLYLAEHNSKVLEDVVESHLPSLSERVYRVLESMDANADERTAAKQISVSAPVLLSVVLREMSGLTGESCLRRFGRLGADAWVVLHNRLQVSGEKVNILASNSDITKSSSSSSTSLHSTGRSLEGATVHPKVAFFQEESQNRFIVRSSIIQK